MSVPRLFLDGRVSLHEGDCLAVLRTLPDASIDAIVTDPPYGILFMGRKWDAADADQRAFSAGFWREALRVLKPGGHLLAFSANRTTHRMTCAIEDAGFEIRDLIWQAVAADADVTAFIGSLDEVQREAFARCCEHSTFGGMLGWVFGSGFPKSIDLPKAIDKSQGVTGSLGDPKSATHAGWIDRGRMRGEDGHDGYQRPWMDDADAVDAAARRYIGGSEASRAWAGFGTALKPALEPITLARKPLVGTVVETVLKHGTAALNIDGCRVALGEGDSKTLFDRAPREVSRENWRTGGAVAVGSSNEGRFPANLITDGSPEVVAAFPESESRGGTVTRRSDFEGIGGNAGGSFSIKAGKSWDVPCDEGSAARFFYSAKADSLDRLNSKHPTIKPLDLMQYLVRLVTPPRGVVLDPFAGTGTTGEAAWREGMSAVLIEREAKHCADIARRMELATAPLSRRSATVKGAKAAEKAERDKAAGKAPAASPVMMFEGLF